MLNLQPVSIFKSLTSIIKSIDLYNYILKDHHRRCSIIAYYIGNSYADKTVHLSELVLAASLHDIGALNIEEQDQLLKLDVENPSHHEELRMCLINVLKIALFGQISIINPIKNSSMVL